jgi:hypothetical protein
MSNRSISVFVVSFAALTFLSTFAWSEGKKERGMMKGDEYQAGISVQVDGELYYFAGPVVGPNGERDVPGHVWRIEGPDRIVGKHYNTGPEGTTKWWSSDAKDGALLFSVEAVIDTWSLEKAFDYASEGFVHYHELIRVTDGTEHPDKVVWLKHTAEDDFNFDGGPMPAAGHRVTKGLDREFMINYFMPLIC